MISIQPAQLPRCLFFCALCILCPLQWLSVSNNAWFYQPPKPVGDGPDYENIAFHLWQGSGFVVDSSAPAWRAPYEQSPHDYAVHLDSPSRRLPTTGRPPLFPLVVAAIYGVVGRNEWGFAAVRLFSASCLAVAGALAVRLTAQLLVQHWQQKNARVDAVAERKRTEDGAGFAERNATVVERKGTVVAVGATATLFLFAVNRTLRDYSTDFLTEPLALLLMQCFVLLAIRVCLTAREQSWASENVGSPTKTLTDHYSPSPRYSGERGSGGEGPDSLAIQAKRRLWRASLLAGITWGALILTRSMFVVWLPAIWLLFVMAVPRSAGVRLKVATMVVVAAGLVCAPWWIRNCIVLQGWMPLGTQGPITLLGGYSDAALQGNGDWQAAPELQLRRELAQRRDFQALANDSVREVWVAEEASRRVRSWIRAHLSHLPLLVARRIYVHWNPYSGASLLWKLPLIVGAVGLLLVRGRAAYWLLGLPLTSTLVVAAFYSTGGRFLVPLYGVLFTLAGLGVSYIVLGVFGWLDGGVAKATLVRD